ncbi:MAG: hypothetical protein AABZ77_01965 [Chloroflexota bacterium]
MPKAAVNQAGPARGNQGAAGLSFRMSLQDESFSPGSLNNFLYSARTGTLGKIGLNGRAG